MCDFLYRSSMDTVALNCLVFEKIAFFAFWRQTDKQMDSTDALSRSRYIASGGLIMYFFFVSTPRSNRRTDSYAEWLKWRVSAQWRSFWGSGWWVTWTLCGKYAHKTPQKVAWICSFKPKRQNLYIAMFLELLIWRTSDLRTEVRPRKALVGGPPLPQSKYNMADGRHENRYDVISPRWVVRFGRNSGAWSFVFFLTGSSNISAVNRDMSTKFGLLIDFDLLKALTLTNTKPEVVCCKIDMTSQSHYRRGRRWSDLDEIRQPDAE